MPYSRVSIIGAPLDLGQGRRGVDMGPSAMRVANLNARLASLGYEIEDLGNVPVEQAEAAPEGHPRAKYLPQIAATCQRLAQQVLGVLGKSGIPLVLGGDHSVAVGTASGNVHGMPLACLVGIGPPELTRLFGYQPKVNPKNAVVVGLRDVDAIEKPHVRDSGVRAFTMRDLDERGLRAVMEEAIAAASEGTAGFHLSLDMDFVDPKDAPGVGTPVRGGATYREAHLAMEMICDSRRMLSMEVVEVNPVIDEVNRTADLAVELAMSGMGKRIL